MPFAKMASNDVTMDGSFTLAQETEVVAGTVDHVMAASITSTRTAAPFPWGLGNVTLPTSGVTAAPGAEMTKKVPRKRSVSLSASDGSQCDTESSMAYDSDEKYEFSGTRRWTQTTTS